MTIYVSLQFPIQPVRLSIKWVLIQDGFTPPAWDCKPAKYPGRIRSLLLNLTRFD